MDIKPSKLTSIEQYIVNRVVEMRKARKISQAQLATLLGVSNAFIGQVETPHHASKYNINHLNKLAIILNCSLADFMPPEPLR